ncbi:hypothetical protein V9K92_01280 [Phyllobacterium sp. CCNWLW109]|uniref:hypothetical protein n=1 Tax=Phyllobacterium sp. CCNWLW109 TaxID=3127479 RepID=UPI0030768D0A
MDVVETSRVSENEILNQICGAQSKSSVVDRLEKFEGILRSTHIEPHNERLIEKSILEGCDNLVVLKTCTIVRHLLIVLGFHVTEVESLEHCAKAGSPCRSDSHKKNICEGEQQRSANTDRNIRA